MKKRIEFYTDQELDAENGLYNYNARLYDPFIGRFISPDTIVPEFFDPQSLNRYSYVLNNPLIYTDPSGYDEVECPEAVVGGQTGGWVVPPDCVPSNLPPNVPTVTTSDITPSVIGYDPWTSRISEDAMMHWLSGLDRYMINFWGPVAGPYCFIPPVDVGPVGAGGASIRNPNTPKRNNNEQPNQSRGWLVIASDISAGFGDTISFGLTKKIRNMWNEEFWDSQDSVDYGSGYYKSGKIGGYAWFVTTGAAGLGRFGFARLGKAWHFGLEYGDKMNIVQIGNHIKYGLHIALGSVAPKVANIHIYFQKALPFFRIWKP